MNTLKQIGVMERPGLPELSGGDLFGVIGLTVLGVPGEDGLPAVSAGASAGDRTATGGDKGPETATGSGSGGSYSDPLRVLRTPDGPVDNDPGAIDAALEVLRATPQDLLAGPIDILRSPEAFARLGDIDGFLQVAIAIGGTELSLAGDGWALPVPARDLGIQDGYPPGIGAIELLDDDLTYGIQYSTYRAAEYGKLIIRDRAVLYYFKSEPGMLYSYHTEERGGDQFERAIASPASVLNPYDLLTEIEHALGFSEPLQEIVAGGVQDECFETARHTLQLLADDIRLRDKERMPGRIVIPVTPLGAARVDRTAAARVSWARSTNGRAQGVGYTEFNGQTGQQRGLMLISRIGSIHCTRTSGWPDPLTEPVGEGPAPVPRQIVKDTAAIIRKCIGVIGY